MAIKCMKIKILCYDSFYVYKCIFNLNSLNFKIEEKIKSLAYSHSQYIHTLDYYFFSQIEIYLFIKGVYYNNLENEIFEKKNIYL